MRDYSRLEVWELAHRFVLDLYTTTKLYPADERYGLTSQTRRAAASIPANIAEGCGRSSKVDFARFLDIAAGSASEVEYHLLLAKDLGYLPEEQHSHLSECVRRVKKMLHAYSQAIRRNPRDKDK